MTAVELKTERSLRILAALCGAAAMLIGCAVIVGGWEFGIKAFRSVLPGLSTMKVNTALGIAALGASLLLTGEGPVSRSVATGAAVLALALGTLTLAEYACHWNAGIDQLLFFDTDTPLAAFPGRPAIATALMIALLGAAQICARQSVLRLAKTPSAVAASLIAWAALNGYVFGPRALQEVPLFKTVALHTAVISLALGIAVLATKPISWPLRMVLARNTGGTVCRWLIPPALLAPPLMGWLLDRSGPAAVYPGAFRWALYSVASSVGSLALTIVLARRITLIDAERSAATELSLHDPLTGLANRRAFDSFLLSSLNLAKRHHHALSLILLDIDWFKSYNDHFGHPAGDELLKSIARLLASIARGTDLVARVGGEEFAIALPETDLAGAHAIAERIRAEMERSPLSRRPVTVSLGVAAIGEQTVSTARLVQACDMALYRAKAGGRNRVSTADEPLEADAG